MFGTDPALLQQALQQQQQQQWQQDVQSSPFELMQRAGNQAGGMLGNALGAATGYVDPRIADAQLMQKVQQESLMEAQAQGINPTQDPAGFGKVMANKYLQIGKPDKAYAVLQQIQGMESKNAEVEKTKAETQYRMAQATDIPQARKEEAIARIEIAKQKLQQDLEIAKQRSEDTRLSIEQRREAAQQHDATMQALHALSNTQNNIKLKPGERFTPEGNVESVPGSDLYIKQSMEHGKQFGALQNITTKIDNASSRIDTILDPKNKSGFEANFGGYNAYATRTLPGNAQKVRREIDSLQSDLASAGLEMMRAGGSIGQMTEKEWPIVRGLLATITPNIDEKDAVETLRKVQGILTQIKDNAQSVYSTEWANTQFYKGSKQQPQQWTASSPNEVKQLFKENKISEKEATAMLKDMEKQGLFK